MIMSTDSLTEASLSLISYYLYITVIPWKYIASNFPFYIELHKNKTNKNKDVAEVLEVKLESVCVY